MHTLVKIHHTFGNQQSSKYLYRLFLTVTELRYAFLDSTFQILITGLFKTSLKKNQKNNNNCLKMQVWCSLSKGRALLSVSFTNR